MKTLKREVYHFNGNDYEKFDLIELTFNVQRVSLNNFINLVKNVKGHKLLTVGNYFNDTLHTSVDFLMKPIKIRIYAFLMYEILQKLGVRDYNEVRDNFYIRKVELRYRHFESYGVISKVNFCNNKIFYLYDNDGTILAKHFKLSNKEKIIKFKEYSTYRKPRVTTEFSKY